ncbi:hypothetical protein D3C80_2222160 [compost metagenome]
MITVGDDYVGLHRQAAREQLPSRGHIKEYGFAVDGRTVEAASAGVSQNAQVLGRGVGCRKGF